MQTEEGSPQVRPIRPILAKIYLHYALDLWFEKKIKSTCKGDAYLMRFTDDFVVNFQYGSDVERFQKILPDRFEKSGWNWQKKKRGYYALGVSYVRTLQRPEIYRILLTFLVSSISAV